MSETSLPKLLQRPFLDGWARLRKVVEDRETRDPVAWRQANQLQPVGEDGLVRFIVPLISRTKANDWSVVCRNLRRTLDSLDRQTNPSWQVTIACQTRPEGVAWSDRIRFLPFPIAPSKSGNDKARKQRFLIRDAARQDRRDGYLFFLDADDLLHPRLVDYILSDNNGHGYRLTRGYMVDLQARLAVAYGFSPVDGSECVPPFYEVCGSSAALRFDMRQNTALAGVAHRCGKHGKVPERVAPFGLHLEDVPFPAALYVFNHGDNLQRHRGVDADKQRALQEHRLDDAAFDAILQEFGVSGIA